MTLISPVHLYPPIAFILGAMYIFVLQWPPALKAAIQASHFSAGAAIPFGTVFSCFMASCLLGSTTFGEAAVIAIFIDCLLNSIDDHSYAAIKQRDASIYERHSNKLIISFSPTCRSSSVPKYQGAD